MDKDYIIFQENGLYGVKDQLGNMVIEPQFKEMNPFSCGLSLVRDEKMRYSYVNPQNKPLFPFGLYAWCDPQFVCGVARVMRYVPNTEQKRWGIINTLGQIILPLVCDNIWALKEEYIHAIKVVYKGKEHIWDINIFLDNRLEGLVYHRTYSVEEIKRLYGVSAIYVKQHPKTNKLFFTLSTIIGEVALKRIPDKPVISVVSNVNGRLFLLLHEAEDTGKAYLQDKVAKGNTIGLQRKSPSYYNYDDTEDWSDPYGDERAYYDGWDRADVESGLADAFEGDYENYNSR